MWTAWVGGVVVIAGAAYASSILPTQWVDVVHVDHGLNLSKRVLQLTDLHVEMLRVSPERIVKVAKEADVDYIFFTGDFLTEERYLGKLANVLNTLEGLGIPMFAVLGNHDYRVRHLERLLQVLDGFGIRILRNEALRMDGFWLVGIDDLPSRHSDVKRSFRNVPAGEKTVVITHDPSVALDIHRPFDYLMAGHLHGKQFRIPGLFHLKPMGPLPKQGIYQGLHQLPMGPVYISKGLSQVGINMRFLVRCELTIHHL